MKQKLSRENRANIAHALMHLEANKITDPDYSGGWYCGNRNQFIRRHIKSIAFLESLLAKNENV